MGFDKFGEIVADDLCIEDTIGEIPSDVLFGPGKRNLVNPVVHLGEFFFAEGRRVHLNEC